MALCQTKIMVVVLEPRVGGHVARVRLVKAAAELAGPVLKVVVFVLKEWEHG